MEEAQSLKAREATAILGLGAPSWTSLRQVDGIVEVANYNCPDRWYFPRARGWQASQLAVQMGAKRAIRWMSGYSS